MTETELCNLFEEEKNGLARQLDLTILGSKVKIGSFELDFLCQDTNDTLVVVELKVEVAKGTLAQLLLYPHALEKVLKEKLGDAVPKIRCLLVTTNLDKNLVEITEKFGLPIEFKICNNNKELVEPIEAEGEGRYWDQSFPRKDRQTYHCQVNVDADGNIVVRK